MNEVLWKKIWKTNNFWYNRLGYDEIPYFCYMEHPTGVRTLRQGCITMPDSCRCIFKFSWIPLANKMSPGKSYPGRVKWTRYCQCLSILLSRGIRTKRLGAASETSAGILRPISAIFGVKMVWVNFAASSNLGRHETHCRQVKAWEKLQLFHNSRAHTVR